MRTKLFAFVEMLIFLLTVASTFAADAMKFVSPDKMSTHKGDEFTFTALVSRAGTVKHLTVVPTK